MTDNPAKETRTKKMYGKIYTSYHKQCSVLEDNFIVPVHAGRACNKPNKDDSSAKKLPSNLVHMVGDDTGDNISARNNEFNECSVLYWIWKNEDYKNLKYVGLFQYRRHLILNNYFNNAKNDLEKRAYKCTHFKKISTSYEDTIGLSEKNVLSILENYDCILPYSTDFSAINTTSSYDDWVYNIPGVHVSDLVELEKTVKELHPEMSEALNVYLNSPSKRMYHIFIAKPTIFNEYCKWLFEILFELDKRIDTTLYSINGKRTLGYLAETLYGFYFYYMQDKIKIKECGVAFIEG